MAPRCFAGDVDRELWASLLAFCVFMHIISSRHTLAYLKVFSSHTMQSYFIGKSFFFCPSCSQVNKTHPAWAGPLGKGRALLSGWLTTP